MSSENKISVGGNVGGHAVAGDGNVVGDGVTDPRIPELLRGLRDQLAANASKVPDYELVVHDIEALAAQTEKPEAKPEFVKSLWGRIRVALAGLVGATGTLAAVGTNVNEINEAITGVFGP
ncbi:hypothetical protein [Actinokineospora xionganensis]|uniref:Uncharacterized protein n=1 Tax=Actinokineospora xionganensis TaxID=2684470 RepID=A0ABR7LGT6_9PSEU|nr:hypothetical protein [Actinokineospora xionganensis]MBC6451492.1 hypothetical protein [Actinokineospora xionganensis]